MIAGGERLVPAPADDALLAAARVLTADAPRVASVCTGAFLLAELGLLDGRRATTHWRDADELARRHPAVRVEPDAIHVRDGRYVTSAGISAGIDLALALVEDDHGVEIARHIAREMVVFLHRPGGQSQYSTATAPPPARAAQLRAVLDAVLADPAGDHRPVVMARALSLIHI